MASLLDRLGRIVPKSGLLAHPFAKRLILGALVVLVVSVALVVQTPPLDLTEGAPAPRTIRANRTVQFIDENATELAREEAAASVEPVYVFDADALGEARDEVSGFFDAVIDAKGEYSSETSAGVVQDDQPIIDSLAEEYPDVPTEVIETAAALAVTDLEQARRSSEQLVTTVHSRRFTEDELPNAVDQMRESAMRLAYPQPTREAIATLIEQSMRPTTVLDATATDAARQAAADEIDAVVIVKQVGENIVQEGEVVTADDLEIVSRLGLLEQGGSVGSLIALVALCAAMVTTAGGYVWKYDRRVWDSYRDLLIIATLFVGMIWITRLVLWWRPEVSLYLLPVPLAAMLATLLISAREGMLVAVLTTLGAVLLGFSGGASVVAMLVWSISAVVAMAFMTDRRRLFYVGAFLVFAGSTIGLMATVASGTPIAESWEVALWGVVGGMLSAVLGYGLLPFFEHAFGVITDIRLLELGNPANPLLRELMVKAPGTYSHSVMTANLVEAGAEAIGANPLLARVGAYYHDIGKVRRPGFFVENQAGGDNPHDSTAPTLSALIITAHVREGLDLAEKHRLPREIQDMIEQHHGTSLVSYFYNKAGETGSPVYEEDFRYDGVRPRSREAGLVMLADSSEAAVRAINKPTPPRIEATVRRVVDAKMADGQLDRSEMTLADIETTINVYSRLLASMYHPRIEYPETVRRPEDAHQYHEPSRS